ncbi:hypothetical protein X777_09797 [Ooceraea biroi]|uniref:Uncharacterized protein n=1 Tax=Ooceraea biroi TaxID=2015173 RepID=A0A026W612_OOCBI|nr:hypothetical protein X777_09797 [Ooceraea biroi]
MRGYEGLMFMKWKSKAEVVQKEKGLSNVISLNSLEESGSQAGSATISYRGYG